LCRFHCFSRGDRPVQCGCRQAGDRRRATRHFAHLQLAAIEAGILPRHDAQAPRDFLVRYSLPLVEGSAALGVSSVMRVMGGSPATTLPRGSGTRRVGWGHTGSGVHERSGHTRREGEAVPGDEADSGGLVFAGRPPGRPVRRQGSAGRIPGAGRVLPRPAAHRDCPRMTRVGHPPIPPRPDHHHRRNARKDPHTVPVGRGALAKSCAATKRVSVPTVIV
jgi:hypothetical protein